MKFSAIVAAVLAVNLPTVFVGTTETKQNEHHNETITIPKGDHSKNSHHHHGRKHVKSKSKAAGATALFKDVAAASKDNEASSRGRLRVAGPLPGDFSERFSVAAAKAAACNAADVKVIDLHAVSHGSSPGQQLMVVDFMAPTDALHAIEDQAADPNSNLATGELRPFLMASDPDASSTPVAAVAVDPGTGAGGNAAAGNSGSIDIDTEMPYGELEPFGREDTGQELTESSIKESDSMVDQLERAEVAEEKRSVFRALTRLRGAAITSFDGIARSQTGNIDEYNKVHQWRKTHPLNHLAAQESDVSKWAFPDNADFVQIR